MPHSIGVGGAWVGRAVLALPVLLAACGSVRTSLPTSVTPAPALEPVAVDPALRIEPSTDAPATTVSAFKSPGEKHPLAGGTLAASYPRVGIRPPKGVALVPAGQAWAVVNVRFCSAATTPVPHNLIDPGRFRVEVPGQGSVDAAADAPALAKAPLVAGAADLAPGTCLEGSISYLVGGEGHIEAVTYDSGAGLLRWAT